VSEEKTMHINMLFPATAEETFLLVTDESVLVPKTIVVFNAWKGKPLANTYGGKAVLDCEGEPLFAELVILRTLCRDGWSGVWVDNYRKKFRVGMPDVEPPITLPADQRVILDKIIDKNGSMSGCWDVYAWKENKILFAESKRSGRDSIRPSQVKWLGSALAVGMSAADFLMVEWSLK